LPQGRELAQASNFSTRKAKDGALGFAQLHRGWADKIARTLGVSLASVALSVWHDGAGHAAVRKVDCAAGHRPVLVVRPPDEQDIAVALVTTTLTDGTRLVAAGADGSS
jgi:hypothetical protein